jgi:SUKH-4 immunity protein
MTPDGWSDAVVDEVRRLWGDQLRPADPGQVYPGLSARTRDFLTTVGLPVFEPNMGVGSVHDRLDQPVSRDGGDYVPIAADTRMSLVYAIEVESDRVCFIGPLQSSDPPRFQNTTVALFVLFLGVFEKDIIEGVADFDEGSDEAYEVLDRARELLTSMDPEVMHPGRSWESRLTEFE